MVKILLGFISWVFGKLFGSPSPQPSEESVQAANAAQAETVGNVAQATAKTDAAIAQAVVDAPKTQSSLESSLDNGTF